MRVVFIVFIGILALGSACVLLPEERVDAPPVLAEPPAPRIVTYEVTRGDISLSVSGLARVASVVEEELYFTQRGRVDEIFVASGDTVQEGDILARLESESLRHNHALATLDLRRQEIRLAQLKQRQEIEGFVNQYELELMQIDYERSRLAFERLDRQLAGITIYAPFSGRVSSVTMRRTEMVDEYQGVITIVDPTALELQLNVSAGDQTRVFAEMPAKVRLDSGLEVDAVVTRVAAPGTERAPGVADRRVHLDLVAMDIGELRYNALLTTRIILEERFDTLLIPRAALREFRDRSYVRVMDGELRREIDVETGLSTRTEVEIVAGLEEGALVIGR